MREQTRAVKNDDRHRADQERDSKEGELEESKLTDTCHPLAVVSLMMTLTGLPVSAQERTGVSGIGQRNEGL